MTELFLRQSYALDLLNSCPAKLRHRIENEGDRKVTKAMHHGSFLHQIVLGGRNYHTIDAKDYRTKAAQQERDGAIERGQTPVLKFELDRLELVAASVRSEISACGVDLDKCDKEIERFWTSPEGIKCKGTPDARFYGNVVVTLDPKFGETANPNDLDRKVFDMGYDIQAAAYEEEYRCNGGNRPYRHLLVSTETEEPFCCTVNPLSEVYMTIGRRRWAQAKAVWKRCLGTREWPEYESRELVPPDYVLRKMGLIE